MNRLTDIRWKNKTALVRADLNAPLSGGGDGFGVSDDSRIRAVVPTLRRIAADGGGAVVMSHLGRPNGKPDPALSLAPVAVALQNALGVPVRFLSECFGDPGDPGDPGDSDRPGPGEFRLLENTRFHPGEGANDSARARELAALGDVFVMDAFACAHRAEASVCALADAASEKCVGLLVERELAALERVMQSAARPVVGIFGGAKISGKLAAMKNLAREMDAVLVGGGAANTLLLAAGHNIGASLAERDDGRLQDAKALLDFGNVVLPEDAIVASGLHDEGGAKSVDISGGPGGSGDSVDSDGSGVGDNQMILDIGEKTRAAFASRIMSAKTVIWNGPVGAFERPAFSGGTGAVARAVSESSAFSLAGGGDTIAAINFFGVANGVSQISTGGGALLEYLEGRKLPGLVAVGAQH